MTETDFKDLKPGDKFDLPTSYKPVTGVCVVAPVLIEEPKRRFRLRKPKDRYHAVCIEIHQYRGGVAWNPKELGDTKVLVYAK